MLPRHVPVAAVEHPADGAIASGWEPAREPYVGPNGQTLASNHLSSDKTSVAAK